MRPPGAHDIGLVEPKRNGHGLPEPFHIGLAKDLGRPPGVGCGGDGPGQSAGHLSLHAFLHQSERDGGQALWVDPVEQVGICSPRQAYSARRRRRPGHGHGPTPILSSWSGPRGGRGGGLTTGCDRRGTAGPHEVHRLDMPFRRQPGPPPRARRRQPGKRSARAGHWPPPGRSSRHNARGDPQSCPRMSQFRLLRRAAGPV